MEKTTSQKLKLGLFVIVGTVLLIVGAYYIGNRQNLFGGTFRINAVFRNINGLQNGNNVRYAGINIGTVKDIEMVNDTTIRVGLMIEEKMKPHIRKNAIASLGTDGLVGSMIINITPGKGSAAGIEPGDEIQTYSRIASDDLLNTLNVTNENAALLTSDLLKITQSIIKGDGTISKLINDTLMSRDMYLAIANLKGISVEVNLAMKEVRQLLEKVEFQGSMAEIILSDPASGQKMKDVIDNLESASEGFSELSGELNLLTRKISEGKGAVNYLATDTNFVSTLDSTMQNIQEASKQFNENMEALKHNFLFRRYFRNQENKSGKKE